MAKVITAAVLLLSAIGWILLLAGTGSMQSQCGGSGYEAGGASGYLGPMPCDKLLGLTWWSVFLELFVLLGVGACAAMQDPERYKIALTAYLSVATVILMIGTNTFLAFNEIQGITNHGGPRTAVAGSIILCMSNLVLIALVASALPEDEWVEGPTKAPPPQGPVTVEMPQL